MHVTGMQEKKCIHIFDAGKNEDKRLLGRPRRRWEKYQRFLLIAWLGLLKPAAQLIATQKRRDEL
jgi:hypothetical protein